MKKKTLTFCAAAVLAATTAISGTLAYFTDTDVKTNTFTAGKVDISLEENFNAEKAKLLPGETNAITKEVSIALEEGSEDAYVWYEWLIPAALDRNGTVQSKSVVHVNAFKHTWDTYREAEQYWPVEQKAALPLEKTWDHAPSGTTAGLVGQEEIDKVVYNKYVVLYHGKLTAENTQTSAAMSQVYMDAAVDCRQDGYVLGETEIEYDFSEGVDIIVRAYGMQAEGFADVYAAYTAYQDN